MDLHNSKQPNHNTNVNDFLKLLEKFSPEELKEIQTKMKSNIHNKNIDNIDISNYKYHYVMKKIDYNKDFLNNINCQSKHFFLEKIKNNIRNICILGLVQSGKTNEIISLVYLCIRYLKIPVIIIIQNRISGYKQLESRIKNFIKKLTDFNFKIKYDKSLNNKNLEKIFNYDNPQPEVIIALANYKQLGKIQRNLDIIKQGKNGRISPFALFMDEYDDLIKRRSDIEEIYSEDISEKDKKTFEKDKKKIEEYSDYIQENSIINVGITATMLAPMLTDNMKIENIFHLTPSINYVGFGSERINIIDITPYVTEIKNKLEIHINKLEYLIDEVDNSVDMQSKDYSILLINISDLSDVHNNIFNVFKNHFEEWSCIKLNSKGEDGNIECTLPNECYSDKKYEIGKHILDNDNDKNKIYDIIEEKCIVPQTCKIAQNKTKQERTYTKHSIKFENCNISDIITHVNNYTNKIAIVSGKMACRGLSFVTNDYNKHITDMIYVPSANSHLTRNVQDMRIFGNFPKDGLNINLYTLENIYKEDIKNYIETQKSIINSPGNNSCQEALHKYIFNEKNVPIRKIDRPALTRGITFNSGEKWGIPTNITNHYKAIQELKKTFSEYKIIFYSYCNTYKLPDNININCFKGKDKKIYDVFKNQIDETLKNFENLDIIEKITETKKLQWFIYENYRNAWPLHNPLDLPRESPLICYKKNKDTKHMIDIIVRNYNYGKKELQELKGKKYIILFYGKDCYHYVNCDQEQYYLSDKFKKKIEQKNIVI